MVPEEGQKRNLWSSEKLRADSHIIFSRQLLLFLFLPPTVYFEYRLNQYSMNQASLGIRDWIRNPTVWAGTLATELSGISYTYTSVFRHRKEWLCKITLFDWLVVWNIRHSQARYMRSSILHICLVKGQPKVTSRSDVLQPPKVLLVEDAALEHVLWSGALSSYAAAGRIARGEAWSWNLNDR